MVILVISGQIWIWQTLEIVSGFESHKLPQYVLELRGFCCSSCWRFSLKLQYNTTWAAIQFVCQREKINLDEIPNDKKHSTTMSPNHIAWSSWLILTSLREEKHVNINFNAVLLMFHEGENGKTKIANVKRASKKAHCTVYARVLPHHCGMSGWAWIALGWPLPTVFLPTCTAAAVQ